MQVLGSLIRAPGLPLRPQRQAGALAPLALPRRARAPHAPSAPRMATRAGVAPPGGDDRAAHNAHQSSVFDAKAETFAEMIIHPEDAIQQHVKRIAGSVPGIGAGSRVLDVGAGCGPISQELVALGVRDILAVDLSQKMLATLEQQPWAQGAAPLGNEPGVRTWLGDVMDLPVYQGPFNAVFINSCYANMFDSREALLRVALMLRPGSEVVISHPLGRAFVGGLHAEDPEMVPSVLPDRAALDALVSDLPLEVAEFVDEDDLYIARLRVPEGFGFAGAPVRMGGNVVTGFGRGSKKMGVPTANLPPEELEEELAGLPRGVYFGWARLMGGVGRGEGDGAVHKMVLNIGQRPTFADGTGDTVEVHILHKYQEDFYGKEVRVVVGGFIRPEMRFGGIDELVARIRTDIGLAGSQLDGSARLAALAEDPFLAE